MRGKTGKERATAGSTKASRRPAGDFRSEYDLAQLKGGVRGKYYKRAKAAGNIVLLDPDVSKVFPTRKNDVSKAETPACDFCGHPGLQTKLVTRSYGKGAALLVIEGIPVHSCPSCGESYLTADTLHEIERIRALRKAVSVVRPVAVATFA